MKKLSVLFALLAVAMFAKAEVGSLNFTANDITVAPGEEASLTIAVDDASLLEYIFNWQCDLYLPEGFSVPAGDKGNYTNKVWDDDDEKYYDVFMYETPSNKSKHETQASLQSDGALRIVTAVASYTSLRTTREGKLVILTIKAEEGVEPGTYEGTIKNGLLSGGVLNDDNIITEPVDIKPAELSFTITVGGAAETTISLKITDAQYSTLILPFDADLPEGLKASTVEWPETGNELVETEVTDGKLLAGVPYLMFGEEVKTYTFTGVPTYAEETGTAGAMVGVLAESTVPAGCYVLQKQDGKVAFYKVTKERAFHANRCYLIAKPNGANMYRIGGTTGIDEVTVEEAGDVYDMLGRKVIGPLEKGVYIKNNRKIYVK